MTGVPVPSAPAPPARTQRTARAHAVVDAARALLERDGAEALTMRRLADELGIQAPSLYKHVPDKGALEAALVEQALVEMGTALHHAVVRPGRRRPIEAVAQTYRHMGLAHPHLYRLATEGELRRDLLPAGLEEWAGSPFFLVTHDEHRAQAFWSFAHGMVILEIGRRYPPGSDLDRTWKAGIAAFAS